MRAATLTLLLPLLATGCIGGPGPGIGDTDSPIIGGTLDTADPGVVLLFAQQPGAQSGSLCTAEVVSPHVVMTAAHCVSPTEVGAGAQFIVFTGSDFNQATQSQILSVKEAHPNPAWDPNNLPAGNDVGVAILDSATSITPLPFNHSAMTQVMVGQSVRFVGYGLDDATNQTGAGVKRTTSTQLSDYDDVKLHFSDGQHETCNGDSGGPAFMMLNGVATIVGVTSYGDVTCSQGGYDTRIDSVASFVDGYIQTNDPGQPAMPSDPGSSSSGSATPPASGGSSEPGTSGGSTMPTEPATAGAGQIGDRCQTDSDCASGACGVGNMGYQVCVPAQKGNATYGGCSVALGGEPAADGLAMTLLFLVGLGLLMVRRRSYRPVRGASRAPR